LPFKPCSPPFSLPILCTSLSPLFFIINVEVLWLQFCWTMWHLKPTSLIQFQ
jgi:hypothetical protein